MLLSRGSPQVALSKLFYQRYCRFNLKQFISTRQLQCIAELHIVSSTRLTMSFTAHLSDVWMTRIILSPIHPSIHPPYKHSSSGPPAGLQSPATPYRPANPHPLDGTEVDCKAGLWGAAGGWPPFSLLFYPLARLCAY